MGVQFTIGSNNYSCVLYHLSLHPNYAMSRLKFTYIVICIFTALFIGVVYFPTAATFDARWNTRQEAYSHGYLIVLISLLFIASKWKDIARAPLKPALWPLLLLLGAAALWFLGEITNVRIAKQLALPAIGLLTLTSLLGYAIGRILCFPFLLLYTVVPFWDVLNPALQALTVSVADFALGLVNVPAYIQDTFITIPAGTFKVSSGCSGLNYLLMSITFALIYSYLYARAITQTALIIAVGVLFGLACNWTRVIALILIGQITDMQSSLIKDHEMLGLIIFAVYLVPLFSLLNLIISRIPTKNLRSPSPDTEKPFAAKAYWLLAPTLSLLITVTGPAWSKQTNKTSVTGSFSPLFMRYSALHLREAYDKDWSPSFLNADTHASFYFSSSEQPIYIHFSIYFNQSQEKELISGSNQLYQQQHWHRKSVKTLSSPAVKLENIQSARNKKNKEIIYWYAIGSRSTTSPWQAKMLQALEFITGRTDASLITLSYDCLETCDITRAEALNLITALQSDYDKTMIELLDD